MCIFSFFRLITFPTKLSNTERRSKWKKLLNRRTRNNKLWTPGKQARVCSAHFPDKEPTDENPFPVLNLGYNSKKVVCKIVPSARRQLSYKSRSSKKTSQSTEDNELPVDRPSSSPTQSTGGYDEPPVDQPSSSPTQSKGGYDELPVDQPSSSSATFKQPMSPLDFYYDSSDLEPMPKKQRTTRVRSPEIIYVIPGSIFDLAYVFASLAAFFCIVVKKMNMLTFEVCKLNKIIAALYSELKTARDKNRRLRKKIMEMNRVCKCKQSLHEKLLTGDKNVLFYTGIEKKKTFDKLYDFVKPFVRRRWKGIQSTSTRLVRKFKSVPKRMGPERRLDGKDEFLLCLMRLRLGLLGKDLQQRFNISSGSVSRIFSSWLRACSQTLGTMVFIPDHGTLNAIKPPHFKPLKVPFQFAQKNIDFAGFQITDNDVQPLPKYLESIRSFPKPKSIADIRAWFGLVNQVSH